MASRHVSAESDGISGDCPFTLMTDSAVPTPARPLSTRRSGGDTGLADTPAISDPPAPSAKGFRSLAAKFASVMPSYGSTVAVSAASVMSPSSSAASSPQGHGTPPTPLSPQAQNAETIANIGKLYERFAACAERIAKAGSVPESMEYAAVLICPLNKALARPAVDGATVSSAANEVEINTPYCDLEERPVGTVDIASVLEAWTPQAAGVNVVSVQTPFRTIDYTLRSWADCARIAKENAELARVLGDPFFGSGEGVAQILHGLRQNMESLTSAAEALSSDVFSAGAADADAMHAAVAAINEGFGRLSKLQVRLHLRGATASRWATPAAAPIAGAAGASSPQSAAAPAPAPSAAAASPSSFVEVVERTRAVPRAVNVMCVLPDGRLAAASDTIEFWNLRDFNAEETLGGHFQGVTGMAVLSDGRLATAGWDRAIKVWNVCSGVCEASKNLDPGCTPMSLTLLPPSAGEVLASGCSNGAIQIWRLGARWPELTSTLAAHADVVKTMCASADGRLVSGGRDRTVKLWSIPAGKCEANFVGHFGHIFSVVSLPDGRIASGAGDGLIKFWDARSGKCEATMGVGEKPVQALCMLPGGQLISGGWNGDLHMWDPRTCGRSERTLRSQSGVTWLCVLPDGRLASAHADNFVKIWRL